MITSADVLLIAPELASPAAQAKVPTTPNGDQYVADAIALLSAPRWALQYDLACKYLAAHRWALAVRGAFGPSGAVVAEAVGSVSRQYAAPSPAGSDPDYDLTPYGKAYLALRKGLLVARLGIVG